MKATLALLLFTGFFLAGCASTGSGPRTASRDVLTQEDITNSGVAYRSAYEVIQSMQPRWLRKRGAPVDGGTWDSTDGDIIIYLNGTRMGGPEALQNIYPDTIARIEYLDTAKAVRLGQGHQYGAILVTTR